MRLSRHAIVLAAHFALAAFYSQQVSAQTSTWDGGFAFGPDAMNQASNWSSGPLPVSGSPNLTLRFQVSPNSTTPNQNIASPLVLQRLEQLGNTYTYNGSGYRFENLGAAPSISVTGNMVFNAPITFQNTTSFTITSGQAFLNGLLSGGANLIHNSATFQTLTIGGAGVNGYSGTIIHSGGQLNLQRSGVATQGDLQVSSGAAVIAISANQFGAASDLIFSTGALMQMNANQVVRDVTLNTGATIYSNTTETLTITGNITSNSGSASIGTNQNNNLDFNGGLRLINTQSAAPNDALVINSTISNGRFNKTGVGTLYLTSGSNSFSGQNIVSAGVLRAPTDAIGNNVLNNAVIELYGGQFNSTVVSGTGQVRIASFITYNAPQTYTGGTDVLPGCYLMGTASTITGNITASGSDGTLQLAQGVNGTLGATLSGNLSLLKYLPGVLSIGGTNTHAGQNEIQGGGVRILSDTAFGSGTIFFGNTTSPVTVEAVGNRTIANPYFFAPGIVDYVGSGNLNFTHTGNKQINWAQTHNSTGTTTINGKMYVSNAGAIVVNAGTFVVGNPSVVGGFSADGPITVNGGVLTVRSLNFTTLPDVTLAGGVLNAPNGYAIPLGAALQGFGGVTGRVASANGSSVLASGNLTMGDAGHVAGVNLDGELYTNQYAVTLQDSNQAVLGAVTQLGDGSSNGTLNASNGLVVNFGRNIIGRGTVNSTNTLAKSVIMNGDVSGDSITNYIEFTGYVKGVGGFNNVAFSGTYAPGLSPALVTVGNVIYTPSNTLDMDLGGLLRGGQFDGIDITGTAVLGGELQLTLINGFNPSMGDQFNLFDGATTGTFASYDYPSLGAGLYWDNSQLYSMGIVQVVPEPAMLSLCPVLALLLRRRKA